MAAKKFYAVRQGRQTGIFETWEECRRMTDGFPNAVYKGFSTGQEAQAYLNDETGRENAGLLQKAEPPDRLTAYVDGSFDKKIGRYSYGCVLLTPDGEIIRKSGSGSEPDRLKLRNVSGEMLGAVTAVKWACANDYPAINICYDYAGIGQWATHGWQANNKFTQEYVTFMDKSRAHIALTFTKIEAHSGNQYNEEADRLAKQALIH